MFWTPFREGFLISLLLASVYFFPQDALPTQVPGKLWRDPYLSERYEKWLTEDVVYIATTQERKEFRNLTSDQQRDEFIAAFWERHNPTPGSAHNAYKEEHYRRIAYANEHFADDVPGWRTDRGHVYIIYGPPDSVELHPWWSPPTETWSYASAEGLANPRAVFTFNTNGYHLLDIVVDPGQPRIGR
jgi:GWxTD domain-containing protein